MTRNTKFFKATATINSRTIQVVFRDLTINELTTITNISDEILKSENASKKAIISPDISTIPFGVLYQVGQIIIEKSTSILRDADVFEVIVDDYRKKVNDDSFLKLAAKLLEVFPQEKFTDLLNLNYRDLIELACVGEMITGKKIINVGNANIMKKSVRKTQKGHEFEDEGKTLADKMKEASKFFGS